MPSYISIGEEYVSKLSLPDRVKGKQFSSGPKAGKVQDGLFADEVLTLKGQYTDRYIPAAERKLGFNQSCPPCRDEFSLVISTEQARVRYKKELSKQRALENGDIFADAGNDLTENESPKQKVCLFDILEQAKGDATFCPRCKRDVHHCIHQSISLKASSVPVQSLHTTSQQIGMGAVTSRLEPQGSSQYARRPIVHESFFRRTGVMNG